MTGKKAVNTDQIELWDSGENLDQEQIYTLQCEIADMYKDLKTRFSFSPEYDLDLSRPLHKAFDIVINASLKKIEGLRVTAWVIGCRGWEKHT